MFSFVANIPFPPVSVTPKSVPSAFVPVTFGLPPSMPANKFLTPLKLTFTVASIVAPSQSSPFDNFGVVDNNNFFVAD